MNKVLYKLLSSTLPVVFVLAGFSIMYLDSTYSIPFYEGIVNGGTFLAVAFFLITQVAKLKAFGVISTNKISLVATLVFMASLSFCILSTFYGIDKSTSVDTDVFDGLRTIETEQREQHQAQRKTLEAQIAKKLETARSALSTQINEDNALQLAVFDQRIADAKEMYDGTKHKRDKDGEVRGAKLKEAEKQLSQLPKQRLEYRKMLEQDKLAQLKALETDYASRLKHSIKQLEASFEQQLQREISLFESNLGAFGIQNQISALSVKINATFPDLITEEQMSALVTVLLVILLECGIILLLSPYFIALEQLSKTMAAKLEDEALQDSFATKLKFDVTKEIHEQLKRSSKKPK